MYDQSRLLISNGPDAELFEIRNGGIVALVRFLTGGVNGKSARDTAIGNLADMSEFYREPLALYGGSDDALFFGDGELIATANAGLIWERGGNG